MRQDFDSWYQKEAAKIDRMSIAQVRDCREAYLKKLSGLHLLLADKNTTMAKHRFYKGQRKFVTHLITYCNERIKLFNMVAHNGAPKNVAVRFLQTASEQLPAETFKAIYSRAALDEQYTEASIDVIRQFILESTEK